MQRIQKLTDHLTTKPNIKSKNVSSRPYFQPARVLVTGAAGNIAYSILFPLCSGNLLGDNQPIDLVLLDIPQMKQKMEGVVMELNDCAFPLVNSITSTINYAEAFSNIDVALLIGAKPRGKGMVRSDLLKANAKIFEGQGKALNKYAPKTVKVVVVGNPANTNALITMKNAPNIPRENFTAMTRLDQNRAISQIYEYLHNNKRPVNLSQIRNIIIWGNHSKTQYPDVNHGYISNYPRRGLQISIRGAVANNKFLDNEFISTVQQRGAAIINARGLSSAASAANACLDHIRSWILGTNQGEIVSMGVISNGEYGIPKDIIYSFPCTCSNGNWKIVENLPIDEESKQKMLTSAQELLEERKVALGY